MSQYACERHEYLQLHHAPRSHDRVADSQQIALLRTLLQRTDAQVLVDCSTYCADLQDTAPNAAAATPASLQQAANLAIGLHNDHASLPTAAAAAAAAASRAPSSWAPGTPAELRKMACQSLLHELTQKQAQTYEVSLLWRQHAIASFTHYHSITNLQ
jgi:hypothetical protein